MKSIFSFVILPLYVLLVEDGNGLSEKKENSIKHMANIFKANNLCTKQDKFVMADRLQQGGIVCKKSPEATLPICSVTT